MTRPGVDFAHTRGAQRSRRAKAAALARAGADLGVVPVQLRQSHPDRAAVTKEIRVSAGIGGASLETWQLAARVLDALLLQEASGRCGSCGCPVLHVTAGTASRLPLDPRPHPEGDVAVTTTATGAAAGQTLRRGAPRPPGGAHRRHSESCPMAPAVQRRRPRIKRRCSSCHGALSPLLPEGTEHHPTCGGDL